MTSLLSCGLALRAPAERRFHISRLVFLSALVAGCGGATIPRATLPSVPTELARCKVAASQSSPLVTEWPGAEKANLEARMREGGVAVAYSGCTMRILPQCRLPGTYTWQRTTPAIDWIEISNSDELYAKLPLGAASLEGELERSGKLAMQTTVSGQMRLSAVDPGQVAAIGGCETATHIVTGVAVGAFSLSSGGKLTAGASVKVKMIEDSGVKTLSEKSLVRQAGDSERCSESTYDYPSADCNSPIQIFLTPLPGRVAAEGPPGTVKVDFYGSDSTWKVVVGKEVICTTPCSKWVDPARPLAMRRRGASFFTRWMNRHRVKVPSLRKHSASGPLQIHGDPGSYWTFFGGLMVTGIGVELFMLGGMYHLMGCDDERDRCSTGKWLMGIGAVVAVPGVWLIMRSWPRAKLRKNQPSSPFGVAAAEPAPERPRLIIGPGFAAGWF